MQFVKLLALVLTFSLTGFAADSPFSGIWKLNTSRSHQIPPAIKSSTAHIQVDERTFKLSQDFVDDKEQLTTVTFDAKLDGKDYPMHGEEPDVTSGSLKRVNDHHIILTSKKSRKVLYTNDMTVSTDGKTLTALITDFTEAMAKKGTVVFEREN